MIRPNLRLPLLLLVSVLAVSACSGGDKESQASAAKTEAVKPATSKKPAKSEKAKSAKAKNDRAKADGKKIKKAKKGAANIAGLTLNMTVEEVKRIAKKKGFKPEKTPAQNGPSFKQYAESKKGGRLDAKNFETIGQLFYEKEASQESLTIRFLPYEKGPRAAEIYYETEAANMTDQLFLERAIKKYGDPHKPGRYPVWEFGEGKKKGK